MSGPNILISGSGVAGSVFAFWMLRAYRNATITIVERASTLRLTGASVDIRSNAVDIIKLMNFETSIRAHSTSEAGIQWVRPSGRPIATLLASGRTDIQVITSEFEIFRGALAKIFIEPSLPRVKLLLNEYVESFAQDERGVDVKFKNSGETKRYDLLVAADGIRSKIRGMMLNTPLDEQIHDEGVRVAYFTIKRDLLNGSKLAKWYNYTGGRTIFLRPDPSGYTRANLMNVNWKSDTDVKAKLDKALLAGNESYMDCMEEMFGGLGGVAEEVIREMRKSDDFYSSLFGQVRSPSLHNGRVVLLGDAGYATPGFGTSLAIMGAYVLAGELLRHPTDFGTALQRYEGLVLPFVKSSQGTGGDVAMQLLNPQSWWGLEIRNAIMGFVTGLYLDRIGIRIAVWFGVTEAKIAMPEYEWPVEEKA